MTFVTATQPLKDLLYAVHEQAAGLMRTGQYAASWEAIYYNFYSPQDQHPEVLQDNTDWIWWYSHDMQIADQQEQDRLLGLVRERIYINFQPDRLVNAFNLLQPKFAMEPGIVEAKRCTPIQALGHFDTVVIYLKSNQATQRFLQELRNMRYQVQLQDSDFRNEVPPGTGRVPDIPGVAVAVEPPGAGQESYGTQLCKVIGEVWDQRCRIGPIPKWDFVGYALRHLIGRGIDVRRPWQVRL